MVFALGKPFQPGIMFAGKGGSLPYTLKSCKGLQETNTLAYLPGACCVKVTIDFSVTYEKLAHSLVSYNICP